MSETEQDAGRHRTRRLEVNTHVRRAKSAVRPATGGTAPPWPPEDELDFPGPYLSMATICEAIELDEDGAISLRRLVDRVVVEVDAINDDGTFAPTRVELGTVVSIHAGALRGQYGVSMQVLAPGQRARHRHVGERFTVESFPPALGVDFTDEDQMFAIAMMIAETVDRVGIHWLEVRWWEGPGSFGRVLTRVPFGVEVVVRTAP
jgi:hypothetical protein